MAFTYQYANETPPAPFVLAIVSRPDGSATIPDCPAKIDTGADRTVIPTRLVEALSLRPIGHLIFAGLANQQIELPVFQVEFVIRDLDPILVEVAGSDGEPYVLLGRDVLNRYHIVLDGPNRKLLIS